MKGFSLFPLPQTSDPTITTFSLYQDHTSRGNSTGLLPISYFKSLSILSNYGATYANMTVGIYRFIPLLDMIRKRNGQTYQKENIMDKINSYSVVINDSQYHIIPYRRKIYRHSRRYQ